MVPMSTNRLSYWLICIFRINTVRRWHCFSDVPEVLAYTSYAIIKAILLFMIAIRWCRKQQSGVKAERKPWSCNNANNLEKCRTCLMQVSSRLALLLFSAPTGYVTSTKDKYSNMEKETDNSPKTSASTECVASAQAGNKKGNCEIPEVYIRNRRASDTDVAILAMVTLTICLVVISTFWYKFWIKTDVRDTCRNEIGIQCFPLINNKIVNRNAHYIANCSVYMSENHNHAKFQCFQFRLNFETTFVVLGGLTSLFLRVSKYGAILLTYFVECIFKHKTGHCCRWCFCFDGSKDSYCYKSHRLLCREILAFVLNVFDLFLCSLIAVGVQQGLAHCQLIIK